MTDHGSRLTEGESANPDATLPPCTWAPSALCKGFGSTSIGASPAFPTSRFLIAAFFATSIAADADTLCLMPGPGETNAIATALTHFGSVQGLAQLGLVPRTSDEPKRPEGSGSFGLAQLPNSQVHFSRANLWPLLCIVAASGCILESNPRYDASVGDDGSSETADNGDVDSTIDTPAGETGSNPSEDSGDTEDLEPAASGCSEPECLELHVGLATDGCPREDGSGCDFVGAEGVREAVAAADDMGGARILVHDDDGRPAVYTAAIEVRENTTLGAAPGVPANRVILAWEPEGQDGGPDGDGDRDQGIVRVTGDDVHLYDMTLICPSGCDRAIIARSNPEDDTSATRGHLFERLDIGSIHPELFGDNGTSAPFALGSDTVVRNCHVWGYWDESVIAADGTDHDGVVLHNNTFVWYETPSVPFDLTAATNVQIANNVFINLGREVSAVATFGLATGETIFVGNLAEGFAALVEGPTDVIHTIDSSLVESAPLESPRVPIVLSDANLRSNRELATVAGTSMDGILLTSTGEALLPGAFQLRSTRALPRPSIVSIGPVAEACDPAPCDHLQIDGDSLQLAVWSTWPGAELRLSAGDYSGVVLTWAISLVGQAASVDDVRLQTMPNGFLVERGLLSRNEAVVRLEPHTVEPSTISGLTVIAGENEHGLLIETVQENAPTTAHELSRLTITSIVENDLSEAALHLGDNVYAHDILIQGTFETCMRTGPRAQNSDATPATRTFIHNLTCRLAEDDDLGGNDNNQDLAAFEIASAVGSVWVNNVVELPDDGPIFRAQRRAGGDGDNEATAVDAPTGFVAQSWLSLRPGDGADLDGFEPGPPYFLFGLQEAAEDAQVFQTPFDAHLVGPGLDEGIDPTVFGEPMTIGRSVDGIDRTARAIDLGCYEQGT